MKNMTFKKITSQRLFLPIFCLALVLLVNIVTTPNFFAIEVRNGVLYGYLIDIINRASELVILAVGSTHLVKTGWNRLPQRARDILAPVLMLAGLVICTAYLVDGSYNPFLYFRF